MKKWYWITIASTLSISLVYFVSVEKPMSSNASAQQKNVQSREQRWNTLHKNITKQKQQILNPSTQLPKVNHALDSQLNSTGQSEQLVALNQAAIASLQSSLNQAPHYMPPIADSTTDNQNKQEVDDELLQDFERYSQNEYQREAIQRQRFLKASVKKIAFLESTIAAGREQGVEDSLLIEAEEKLAMLKMTRQQIAKQVDTHTSQAALDK